MKPQNKFQAQVVKASKKLPPLTEQQIQWGYDNCIEHIGRRTAKGEITCTACSHSWQGGGELMNTLLGNECPNCKAKLKVETTTKRVFSERYYMTVITACEGFQVLRTVMMLYDAKVGELPQYRHYEVMQRWIAPSGKHCTFARLRQTMGTCYVDSWIFHTDLELRSENSNNKFSVNVYDQIYTGIVYPRQKLIPELKRTGYKRGFYGQKPLNLFRILLTDNKAETLLKTKQTSLFTYFMDNDRKIEDYWPSIRICIRNGYKVKDASLWCDYIDFLRALGKDLHNTKYVCPADLNAEHDRCMNKLARLDAQREIEGDLSQHIIHELNYRRAKAQFFGLEFSDGLIKVRVIESARELKVEGKAMHHCVGGYHSKEDSLVLSATINGKRIETVEVSISKLKVTQCRGACNQNTKHHRQIIELVGQNMSLIQQRLTA